MKVSGELHGPDVLTLRQVHSMTLNRKLGGSRNGLDAKEKKKSKLFQENVSILVKSIFSVLQNTFKKNNVELHFL
jgi:hypothetical protein